MRRRCLPLSASLNLVLSRKWGNLQTFLSLLQVLKWVEEAVQASKVHLLSTDHLHQAVNTWKIPFDPSLKEVTVSLSGPSPAIEIRNPFGKMNQTLIIKCKEQAQLLFAHFVNQFCLYK